MGRIVAIDYGSKRIGLAVGDAATRIALPWRVLVAQSDPGLDAERVMETLVRAGEQPALFVVGLPRNMDGTEGPQARLTRAFGKILAEKSRRPVVFQDERLSSFAAESKFHTPLKDRLRRRPVRRVKPKKPLDAIAAAVILESYLRQTPDPSSEGPE